MASTGFSFSDLVAGYVTTHDADAGELTLQTSDGRDVRVKLTDTTAAEIVRNLGEPYTDCSGQLPDLLEPGRFVYAYGIHYPEDGAPMEAKHVVLLGRSGHEFRFEQPQWWIHQIRQLADFYLRAQFGDGEVDYREYRTTVSLSGVRSEQRQETDTISRLTYGFASAYLLTGDERYLDAAEKGTAYLRKHFRAVDIADDTCYWYHAIELAGDHERKILASEFGDDYDAIPAYEQIYALAGPVQTYRATGDAAIREDARLTLNLFDKYFLDRERGGYFSHIDPVTFDARSEALGRDRARKNWNSVGDHAPAYLINLYLATGDQAHADRLAGCADLITAHFPDYDHSAFVQERFHEDWQHDQTWGWQQNRAVVGHNLKIAWNLMRIWHLRDDKDYLELAERIAELMPRHGMDPQRGGWYDVVERELEPGQAVHRFAWHDRKAWWQQEQGILAYLILHGSLGRSEYLKYARESAAYYSAWQLDHDAGGVYFNVLAGGLPYLMGTERLKGSHSMSGYHSFELCYLSATYTNLLISKQPLDLHFKPLPGAFGDNILRVAPDLLPPGSVRIDAVTLDDQPYDNFDAEGLTVTLPGGTERVRVKVRLVPTAGLEHFTATSATVGGVSTLTLSGRVDARAIPHLREALAEVSDAHTLVIDASGLAELTAQGVRALTFAKQKMADDADVTVRGANDAVRALLVDCEIAEELTIA